MPTTKYLLVESDHNDADYMSRLEPISDEDLETLRPVFKAIKNFKPYTNYYDQKQHDIKGTVKKVISHHRHNWPRGEYCYRPDMGEKSVEEIYPNLTEDQIGLFEEEFLETSENGDVHTVESIRLLTVTEDKKLV